MYFKKILFGIILLFPFLTYAQINNKRCKWIRYTNKEFSFDSATVFPQSLKISYPQDTSIKIFYNLNTNKARINSAYPLDSVLICYSVLPYRLGTPLFKRSLASYDSNSFYREDFGAKYGIVPETREEIFSSPGLNKTGNVSRGISFGNNQNVFVNSVLNLQMEGKLTDDITLTAAISDQNIPFQPDGNTQQLQQFDKVFVQLASKKSKLVVGDIVMRNKPDYFLKYYKNVQGGQVEVNYDKDSTFSSSTSAGAAVAKGKFASIQYGPGQQQQLLEGVQGPYRLKGPNGERFIVILANSERIYLDGRPLTRGFDFDYTIDYNLAEITFTPNIIITKFTRIRVDFEYSDRNYSRTILNANHYQNYKKTNMFFNYYSEKDNPRNPLTLQLDNKDKILLSQVGDSIQSAFVSGVDSTNLVAGTVRYKRLSNAAGDTIYYQYSNNPDSALYAVKFTQFPPGEGTYVVSNTTANEKIFQYVGKGRGDYLPIQLIPTPKKRQMVTLGGGVDLSKSDNIYTELALSQYDLNLFSTRDSQDDNGQAMKVGYVNKGRKVSFLKNYQWIGNVDFEFDQRNFNPIDRFRDVDFDRNWSADINKRGNDHIFNISTGIIKDNLNTVNYRYGKRGKNGDVNGFQHELILNKTIKNFQILSRGFISNNDRKVKKATWRRANVNMAYNTKYIVPGLVYNTEKNMVKTPIGEVLRSSMYFDEVKFYVKSNDTLKTKFFLDHSIRIDSSAFNGQLKRDSKAQTTNVGMNRRISENNEINITTTYRYLQSFNPTGIKLPNEETILGRFDWNASFLKKHIRSELTVTTGTGQELQRLITYIPVQTGLGNYVYRGDENKNGLQDLDEFSEKVRSTGDSVEYIRTFAPTDKYIKAYANTFNYRFDLTAPRRWADHSNRLKHILSKFSNISSWNVNKKITDNVLLHRFSPSLADVQQKDFLSGQKVFRSTLFFNRSNPKYGMDLAHLSSLNRQFLVQGFESRAIREYKFNTRANISHYLNLKLITLRSITQNSSDYLASRNYKIQLLQIQPELSYQPKNNLRFTGHFSYKDKMNLTGPEKVKFYETGLELKINKVLKRTLITNIQYIKIVADPQDASFNSSVGYEMLEALQAGNNLVWNATWQEKLTNGLQLSFNYEGRKSQTSKMIHIGRMQVSALF